MNKTMIACIVVSAAVAAAVTVIVNLAMANRAAGHHMSVLVSGAPVVGNAFEGSKAKIAMVKVQKYAFDAYPSWSMAHPDKACPNGLADLNEYMNDRDENDPWGRPLHMMCGASLPAGAKGIAIASDGPDGQPGTPDDIKSWE